MCNHKWVNAKNGIVMSGLYCSICGTLSKETVKQNKQKGNAWIITVILLSLILAGIINITQTKDIARLEKYDKCLTEVVMQVPDPNETEERSSLLQACMNE